jgi:hypothetical protein
MAEFRVVDSVCLADPETSQTGGLTPEADRQELDPRWPDIEGYTLEDLEAENVSSSR